MVLWETWFQEVPKLSAASFTPVGYQASGREVDSFLVNELMLRTVEGYRPSFQESDALGKMPESLRNLLLQMWHPLPSQRCTAKSAKTVIESAELRHTIQDLQRDSATSLISDVSLIDHHDADIGMKFLEEPLISGAGELWAKGIKDSNDV